MTTEIRSKVRGTIIKVPANNPGFFIVDGAQRPFTLEGVWGSAVAPTLKQIPRTIPTRLRTSLALTAILATMWGWTAQFSLADPHPQTGIQWNDSWTGLYQCPIGVQRAEVVRVSQQGRKLIATKLTGDECVSAGSISWEAALPKPVITADELPLSINVVIAEGAPGRPTGRVWRRLTIVAPDRMIIEGGGGIALTRGVGAPQRAITSRPVVDPANVPAVGPPSSTDLAPSAPKSPLGVSTSRPLASAPPSDAPKPSMGCNIQKIDWKNFRYPEEGNNVGMPFQLQDGGGDWGGESISFEGAEYGDIDGNGRQEAFVELGYHDFRSDTDSGNVFVFEMDSSCSLRHLGTMDMGGGKLTDKSYVVKIGKKRVVWRIVDGKLQKTERK